ncbi:hypothetical protein [Pedobacter antarcticus]|uniref:hypothetical protein n=1 Tax=Pedobacter antarcticus TaxID=34086 RepID=UPI002931A852|nr:hypothetical protein [Pedobacter antarcticus]
MSANPPAIAPASAQVPAVTSYSIVILPQVTLATATQLKNTSFEAVLLNCLTNELSGLVEVLLSTEFANVTTEMKQQNTAKITLFVKFKFKWLIYVAAISSLENI